MKKLVLVFAVLVSSLSFAQEQGKFRGSLDVGYASPAAGGGGVLVNGELGYNVMNDLRVGFRVGGAALAREVDFSNGNVSEEAEVSSTMSYLATIDKAFNSGSKFAPFVGIGVGMYSIASTELTGFGEFESESKFGGMLRVGFELGKLRLLGEYNYIPVSEYSPGVESKNSYIGFSVGFFLGGGKWGN